MDIKTVQDYFRKKAGSFKGNAQTKNGCAQIKQGYVAWNTNPGGGLKARKIIFKLDVEKGLIRVWMYTNSYWEGILQKLLGEKKIPRGAGLFPFTDGRRTARIAWSIRETANTIEDAVKKLNELYDAYNKDLKERGSGI